MKGKFQFIKYKKFLKDVLTLHWVGKSKLSILLKLEKSETNLPVYDYKENASVK